MLVAALTLLNAPASFNRLEVAVSPVEVISSSQLERLPVADLSQILTVRPQSPSQPVERSGSLVLVDGARTASDINALNNIESIQVLRGPQGTLYGRSEADALGSVVHLALRDTQRAYENVKLRGFSFDPKQGIQSGGFTQWTLSSSYKDLFGNVQVFGVTEGGQPARTLLGSRQVYLGTYLDPDPPKSQFFPDTMPNSRLLDTIGGMTLQPKYADMLGTSQILIPPAGGLPGAALTTNATSYFANTASYYGSEMVNGWVQRSGLQMGQISQMMMGAAAQGSDMNSLTFPGDPGAFANSDCGSNVRFPGGTLWVPDQAGYQTMMNASPFRYQFRGFHASLDGGEIQGQMRTYCLNMELKEPAPGVRYFPYAPTTPVLGALAKIENRSTVRGLYDQARTWIYTDKAPLAEINKRLFPTITPGRYVTSLWEVVRVGGFTTKDLARAPVFDPSLLLAKDAGAESFGWFSTHVARAFPAELAKFVSSNPELRKLLTSGDAHGAKIVRSVLSAPTSPPRLAMLRLLQGLEGSALKGQVGDLRASLYSEAAEEVEAALAVSEKWQTARPEEALRYLSSHGASEGIKSRAKALLGS